MGGGSPAATLAFFPADSSVSLSVVSSNEPDERIAFKLLSTSINLSSDGSDWL